MIRKLLEQLSVVVEGDERLRSLERAVATGDPSARERLSAERRRRGGIELRSGDWINDESDARRFMERADKLWKWIKEHSRFPVEFEFEPSRDGDPRWFSVNQSTYWINDPRPHGRTGYFVTNVAIGHHERTITDILGHEVWQHLEEHAKLLHDMLTVGFAYPNVRPAA